MAILARFSGPFLVYLVQILCAFFKLTSCITFIIKIIPQAAKNAGLFTYCVELGTSVFVVFLIKWIDITILIQHRKK